MEEPDRQISVETLYRKWAAIREGDYGALVDMRGKARKGMSKMPEAIERVFLSLFLAESQLPVPRCIALGQSWLALGVSIASRIVAIIALMR